MVLGTTTLDGSSSTRNQPRLTGRAHIKGGYRPLQMILLTTGLMGLQFTWAVEMAFGTPFLLQLGLSKSLMSLVWLAGPLSGLVMQPIVGVLSDQCKSRMGRRRPFLIAGVSIVISSYLCLGWCREITSTIFGKDFESLAGATILMAVGSIYILDFAINCVQASCRTLIVDSLPAAQQEQAAAWASRMMGIGGIFGYFMGNIDLPNQVPIFGDTQMKCLSVIACVFLALCVGITCWAVTEQVLIQGSSSKDSKLSALGEFVGGFKMIFVAIRFLPKQIQRLCRVQFFAWMGWFPFLFYSSTYVAEIFAQEEAAKQVGTAPAGNDGTTGGQVLLDDAAVRAGSFCLLVYSIVSLASSILLPLFISPEYGSHTSSSNSTGISINNNNSSSSSSKGKATIKALFVWFISLQWLQYPIPGLTLPVMFTISLGMVASALMATFFVQDIFGTTLLFSLCGVSWAVCMWAPFSILGQVISMQQKEQHQERVYVRKSTTTSTARHSSYDMNGSGSNTVRDMSLDGRESVVDLETGVSRIMFEISDEDEDNDYEETGEDIRMLERKQSRSPPISGSIMAKDQSRKSAPPKRQSPLLERSHSSNNGSSNSKLRGSFDNESKFKIDRNTFVKPARATDRENEDVNEDEDEDDEAQIGESASGQEPEEYQLLERPSSRSSQQGVGRRNNSSQNGAAVGASAGALLGIHNMFIVIPQFLVSFLSSFVFAAIDNTTVVDDGSAAGETGTVVVEGNLNDPNTIGVMLRFGGLMAAVAMVLSVSLWRTRS